MKKHFYSKTKIFNYIDKINSLPYSCDKILPPIHIRIKPTNVCNHSCFYCAFRVKHMQLGKDMAVRDFIPKEKISEIIGDLVEMGVKAVTFSGGGEPFCYPYFLDAITKLAKTRIKFACLTNGSLLSGETAEIFAHCGAWLRISMDGWDDESYSSYRGVPRGEFAKTMKNIENFKKLGGKCCLGVSLVVDKNNASNVHEMIGKLKDSGVDSVKVSACIISNSEKENNEYHDAIYSAVKEQIAESFVGQKDDSFELNDSYHKWDIKFKKDYRWCPYLQILPVIGADLNVYSCQDKAYNLKEGLIGSIKKKRFKEFWFGDKSKFFKIDPASMCRHHCVANSKNEMILEYLNVAANHLGFV